MTRTRIVLLTGTLALLFLVPSSAGAATKGTECEGADTGVSSANVADSERTLLCIVNVYRSSQGLAPLTEDPALMRAARAHSDYLESTDQFAHTSIGDGTPSSRAAEAGFDCGGADCVGENIATSNFPGFTPQEMFEGWRNSPGHNANMLQEGYVTAGMGFALGGHHGLTGTQNFATVSNGATGTAADLLTSPGCTAGEDAVAAAERKVAKAKSRVKAADGHDAKQRAKRKLHKAKAKLKASNADAAAACDLTY